MDALLLDLQTTSEQLLPIIGAVALIFLCILLKKAWELIEELTKTVKDLGPTIKLVDQSMEKVQAPLDTAVKISHTVDDVHDKAASSVTKVVNVTMENFDKAKGFIYDFFNKEDAYQEDTIDPKDAFEAGFYNDDETNEDVVEPVEETKEEDLND